MIKKYKLKLIKQIVVLLLCQIYKGITKTKFLGTKCMKPFSLKEVPKNPQIQLPSIQETLRLKG